MQRFRVRVLLVIMIWSNVAFSWYYPSHDFCAEDTEISFLHDPEGSLSQDAVLEKLRGAPKVLSPQTLSFGYTKGKVWLYLKVSKAEGLQKCVLELANPQLDEIEIYQFVGGQSFKVASMGDQFSFTERFYRVRNYVFPFQADQNQEFIISLQSSATMTVPVSIKWRDQYVNDSSLDYLLLGLFYGLMLCFIFVGIHNLVSFREKSFGTYALFAIFLMFFFLDRDGIAYQFLWPHSTYWKLRSVRVFAAIAMGFGVLYFVQILQVQRFWLKLLTYTYIALAWSLGIVLLFVDPSLTNIPTIIVSSGTPILMIVLSLSRIKDEDLYAKYLLGAGIASLCGLTAYSFSVTGIIESNYFTNNAMKITTVIEFIFLTFGINRKIRHTIKNKALHKAVFEVSNMMAHDVRKPLDKMEKFLGVAKNLEPSDLVQYVDAQAQSIETDIKYADAMVSDLVSLGRESNSSSEAHLSSIIQECCGDKYQLNLGYKGLIKIDCVSLKRVLDNIIKNADQATVGVPNSQFWITTEDLGKNGKIHIGNTGSKIDHEDLSKVFQLFYTQGIKVGTGIGLALVDKVVRDSGGILCVESNGVSSSGKKTKPKFDEDYVEFQITLPKGNRYEKEATHPRH